MKCPECGGNKLLVWYLYNYDIDEKGTFFKNPQYPDTQVRCATNDCDIYEQFEVEEVDGGFGVIAHTHNFKLKIARHGMSLYECPCGEENEEEEIAPKCPNCDRLHEVGKCP